MTSRLAVWLLLAAGFALPLRGAELNGWPLRVASVDDATGTVTAQQGLGPLLAERTAPDGAHTRMLRPLFLHETKGRKEAMHFVYPLVTWRRDGTESWFSIFQIVNGRREAGFGGQPVHGLDVWPLYFSRQTGDPATSYRGLLPIVGEIKDRFGKDRLSWTAFPLYFRVEKDGRHTDYVPWPFLRFTAGNGHNGLEFWPLFGHVARAGDYENQYYLWPLIYKQVKQLDEPAGASAKRESLGFLPFYTRATAPGYIDENYLWPFFGYTDRSAPKRYHETRYFWPFLVQGRGDERYINRWAPLYTHSVVKGYDKTWIAWPLMRNARWSDAGIANERNQFLFFVYWSHEQRSLTNPAAAPAFKKHLWPLFSVWDNGAGRRQLQLLSPIEVFFPNNQPIRELYTPLFALYRYDQRALDDTRWSILWSLVSRRRSPTEREFHLGPLFSTRTTPHSGERVAIGNGLLSWRRAPGERRWKFSVFDFRRSVDSPAATAALP
jgi:hypothetical protein